MSSVILLAVLVGVVVGAVMGGSSLLALLLPDVRRLRRQQTEGDQLRAQLAG